MDTGFDILVIGAGLAGLGAAWAARAAGRRCLILEASARTGGRAWTTYPAALGGVWFDMGAVWLHDAEHNPLVPIAEAAGDRLLRSDEIRTEHTNINGRRITAAMAQRVAYTGDRTLPRQRRLALPLWPYPMIERPGFPPWDGDYFFRRHVRPSPATADASGAIEPGSGTAAPLTRVMLTEPLPDQAFAPKAPRAPVPSRDAPRLRDTAKGGNGQRKRGPGVAGSTSGVIERFRI